MKTKRPSEFLTEDEAKALLRVPDRRTLKGKRDYALLLLMLNTGLRKAEVCSLSSKDLATYRNQLVLDVIGKGGKYRRVPLKKEVVDAIHDYRKMLKNSLPGLFLEGPGVSAAVRPLFLTLGERGACVPAPLTHKAVDCLVRRVRKGALIGKRVTPHVFRHSFATNLLDKSVDLETVRQLMGHSNLRTTQVYCHSSDEKKIDAVSRLQFAL